MTNMIFSKSGRVGGNHSPKSDLSIRQSGRREAVVVYRSLPQVLIFALFASIPALAQHSFTTFQAASVVIGQANFTDQITTASQTVTFGPTSVAVSATGKMAVGEQSGGRVLIWNSVPMNNGMPANVVVGKPDFNSTISGVTASLTRAVEGVAFSPDGGKLLVCDTGNNRVLIWNSIPTANGQPADVVIGQTDFTTGAPGAAANKLYYPAGVLVTPDGKLVVTDYGNHRVLIFNSIPTSNGASADLVIGQTTMTASSVGSGSSQMFYPWQCAYTTEGKLLIADEGNHRVVVFNALPTTNGAPADIVIGQAAFGTSTPGTTASRLTNPIGVAVSPSGQLAIGEYGNSRVLIYNSIPTSNGMAADVVLGQPDFTSNSYFNGGVGAQSVATVYQLAYAPDGRLLVSGRNMHRVMIFGSLNILDSSFSSDGVATVTPPGITGAKAWAMTVAPDGKVVMAGEGNTGSRNEVLVARFLPDGDLDASFDSDGWVTVSVGTSGDTARGVVVQDDGKIVICGRTQNATLDSFVLRFETTGALDSSFGSGGKVTWGHGASSDDEATAVALVGPEEDIVIAGASNANGTYDFAITRLNSNGSFDSGFGSGGKTVVSVGASTDLAYGIAVDPADSSLVVSGAAYVASYDFAMIRLSSSGVLVPGFGSGGKQTADFFGNEDFGLDVVLQPDRKIVIGGYANNGTNHDVAVARFNSNGLLDTSFSGDGKVTVAIGSGGDVGNGVKIDGSGRIVVAAEVQAGAEGNFGVARFTSAGVLDSAFNGSGSMILPVSPGFDKACDVAIDGMGRILIGGTANEGAAGQFALARIFGEPVPDIQVEWPPGTVLANGSGSDFGDVLVFDSSPARTFTIRNVGAAPLTGLDIGVDGGNPDDFDPGSLGATSLNPGATTTFEITFTPGGYGLRSAVVSVSSNDPDGNAFEIEVMGTGSSRPPIAHDRTVRAPAPGYPVGVYSVAADVTEPDGEAVTLTVLAEDVPGTVTASSGVVTVELTSAITTHATITVRATDPHGAFDDAVILLTGAPAGSLDPLFDMDGAGTGMPAGFGILGFPGVNAAANDIKVLPDGKVLAVGNRGTSAAVARFHSNGVVDASFGTGGCIVTPMGTSAVFRRMALLPNGRIIAVGHAIIGSVAHFLIVRYESNGALDASFDGDGILTMTVGTSGDLGTDVGIQSDGKIVIAGYSYTGAAYSQSIIRLLEDGTPDTSFSEDGKAVIQYAGNSLANGVELVAGGKIVLSGHTAVAGSSDFCATRLLNNGTVDETFGTAGKVVVSLSAGDDYCESLVMQSDGKLLLAGRLNGPPEDFAFLRLNEDGSPDTNFGTDGKQVLPASASFDRCQDLAIQPDGKIVAVGVIAGSYEDMAVVRMDSSGALDTSFGSGGILYLVPGNQDDGLFSVEVEADGDIIAGGYSEDDSGFKRMAVMKLNCLGAEPTLIVEYPVGTALSNGATGVSLGAVPVGSSALRAITIHNTGAGPLYLSSATINADPAGSFIDSGFQRHPIPPGGLQTYLLYVQPQVPGPNVAAIGFVTNAVGGSPFGFSVVVTGVVPEIAVDGPTGADLPINTGLTFDGMGIGRSSPSQTITVKNTGDGPLLISSILVTGVDPGDFPITGPVTPLSIPPGGSENLTISFSPGGTLSSGRNAALQITSNDPDESPFGIGLEGLALSTVLDEDNDGMNDWAEYRLSPVGFDWQMNQTAMVDALYAGANDAGLYTPAQVQTLHLGTPLISRNPYNGKFKLTLDWKKATDLTNFADFPAAPAEVSVDGNGDIGFEFSAPDPAAFFRIEIE